MALFVAIIVLVGLSVVWLRILNRKHAQTRESMGKSAIIVDHSMETKEKFSAQEDSTDDLAAGVGGDKGFDDVTDLNNEDFIYVY